MTKADPARKLVRSMAFRAPTESGFPVEMNRDDKVLAVHPPHPEEGASTYASEETRSLRGARLEGWGGRMVRDAAHEAAEPG